MGVGWQRSLKTSESDTLLFSLSLGVSVLGALQATMPWVLTANYFSVSLGIPICSSRWGLHVLKPQGQISHWLFDDAAFQKQCGMSLTSRNINLTLWSGGIWKHLLFSYCQGGSVSTKIKSIWVPWADGEGWRAWKVHCLMCLGCRSFNQR